MTLIQSPKPFKPSLPLPLVWLGKLFVAVSGWKFRGEFPGFDKWMLVEYPHTSNWDGFLYMIFASALGLRSNWMVKDSVTKNFFGRIFLKFGAIPIDRSASRDTVQSIVEAVKKRDRVTLLITPEGTRKHTPYLKAGFYWISYHAQIPMTLITADYRTKEIIVGPSYMPTGDLEADLKVFYEWFKDRPAGARYPENAGTFAVKPSSLKGGTFGKPEQAE
ncbi:MAG: 1-acyl-sn-glycerol-3-phosphate acyltransferase [Anaerolineae bacterium]|jgi:1-acyl-sn-glycerol-3-phosphate acyltransferase|nr:1-acyl-sn-glycerol-3-phosphate acyltransferase [Anaerolineae bacterium]